PSKQHKVLPMTHGRGGAFSNAGGIGLDIAASKRRRQWSRRRALGRAAGSVVEALESRVLMTVLYTGTVYDDANHDGMKDIGEAGLDGYRVVLTNHLGHVVDDEATASGGSYTLDGTSLSASEAASLRVLYVGDYNTTAATVGVTGGLPGTKHFGLGRY